jgi:hypothetical protein
MKLRGRIATLTMAVCLCWHAAAFASETAYLYLVHGVPGRDVSVNADPTLPVDVLVNDEVCYLHGFTFGTVSGPLTLNPGQYDIKVSAANSLAPCTNVPLIDSTVTLGSGQNSTAVVALNDSGVPVLPTFANDFQPIAMREARLSIDYAGGSSAIEIVIRAIGAKNRIYNISPGQRLAITLPTGAYTIEANLGGVTLASESIGLPNRSATLLFLVGNTGNQSLNLVNRTVRDVF